MTYALELEIGLYLAPWPGDPGRTLIRKDAKTFRTLWGAERALKDARTYRPFPNAMIIREER
jgi:hypothetical protein